MYVALGVPWFDRGCMNAMKIFDMIVAVCALKEDQ